MITWLPIIRSQALPGELAWSLARAGDDSAPAEFADALGEVFSCRNVYLLNSGAAALMILLKAMRQTAPGRGEVVLPAYSAGSLVVAVRAAGLRPVLCDIGAENASEFDRAQLEAVAGKRTLAVVCVHLFGIGMRGLDAVRARASGAYIIEDCAQSMGTVISGVPAGTMSDAAIYSFNRGKNLPVGSGGCIATSNAALADSIRDIVQGSGSAGKAAELKSAAAALAFSAAANPFVCGAGMSVIRRFKATAPPASIPAGMIPRVSAALGVRLLRRHKAMSARRQEIGRRLADSLSGVGSLRVPEQPRDSVWAYNRIPLLFSAIESLMNVEASLGRAGIESSRMYGQPLHHMFELGYDHDNFPHACSYARMLLTLPAYPNLTDRDVERMLCAVRKAVRPC